MKDKRQGAASIVFLIYYSFIFSFLTYLIVTRRPKRYIFGPIFFAFLRLGANIASLGWAIHLYENFDWLIASLILGAEGESMPSPQREKASFPFLLMIYDSNAGTPPKPFVGRSSCKDELSLTNRLFCSHYFGFVLHGRLRTRIPGQLGVLPQATRG